MKRASLWIAWLAVIGALGVVSPGLVLAQNTDTPAGEVNAKASESSEPAAAAAEKPSSEPDAEFEQATEEAATESGEAVQAESAEIEEPAEAETKPEDTEPGAALPEEGGEAAPVEAEETEAATQPSEAEAVAAPEPAVAAEPTGPAPEPVAEVVVEESPLPPTDYSGLWRALDALDKTMSGAVEMALTAPRLAPTLLVPGPVAGPSSAPVAPREPRRQARTRGVVTVFGRPGQAGIIDEGGAMQPYSLRDVALRNQPNYRLSDLPQWEGKAGTKRKPGELGRQVVSGSSRQPSQEGQEAGTQGGEATGEAEAQLEKPAEEPAAQEGGETPSAEPQDNQAQPVASAGNADEKAAREQALAAKNADIERIRRLRQDGAWFYNSDGTPMTNEQLNARLASGNVESIKAVDRYQTSWTAKNSYEPPETAVSRRQ